MNDKLIAEIKKAAVDLVALLRDVVAEAETVQRKEVADRGRVIVVDTMTMCDHPGCGLIVEVGDHGVIRTNSNGRKEIIHADHLLRGRA